MKLFFQKIVLFIVLMISSVYICAKDKMIFAVEVFRHGDRTPVFSLPESINWENGLGELTALGMRKEYLLGKKLRNIYYNQYHLIQNQYKSSEIYVRSTNFNRTLMSAESLLLGLYPLKTGPKLQNNDFALPSGYQPIPVHTLPQKDDSLLIPDGLSPETNIINQQLFFNKTNKTWMKQQKILLPLSDKWSRVLGINAGINNIKQINNIIAAADNVKVRTAHGVKMPAGLSGKEIQEMIDWGNILIADKFILRKVGAIISKEFIINLNIQFNDVVKETSTLKLMLFSGHETTLLGILSALGAPLSISPPYSSHISIQLFKNNSNNYYFTVQLNDEYIKIPSCNDSDKCTLTQLQGIIKELDQLNTQKFNKSFIIE